MTPVQTLLRRAARREGEPLNVLTTCTHEAYETALARTNCRFWAYQHPSVKTWNAAYRPVPENYAILDGSRGPSQLPPDVEFDLALAQNKFGSFQLLAPLARAAGLPLVSLEHTAPPAEWPKEKLSSLGRMRGDLNVFITEWSALQWGWDPADPSVRVVHHGIDTETFSPAAVEKEPNVLSVVNDWRNRDWCCGYTLWEEVTRGLLVRVVGDTPGLSRPAGSVAELVDHYRHARVFLNTSLVSPVPTALLEAMACGCAVVSTATSNIPNVVTHGSDGLLSNDPRELRRHCERLLADEALAAELGANARRTVEEKYSLARFARDWDAIFREAAEL